jgi:hypothetical protein
MTDICRPERVAACQMLQRVRILHREFNPRHFLALVSVNSALLRCMRDNHLYANEGRLCSLKSVRSGLNSPIEYSTATPFAFFNISTR